MQTVVIALLSFLVVFIFALSYYARKGAIVQIEKDFEKTREVIKKVDEQTAQRLKDYFYERWDGRINRWVLLQYMHDLD